ncbi:MAG: hypothetical protein R8K50_09210 [Mariprofundus sp.]
MDQSDAMADRKMIDFIRSNTVGREQKSSKENKKEPAKTAKEKKAAKQAKKAAR